ncbi:MAG: hypothetical protein ABIR56_03775 [Polaromonas sp.]
MNKAKLKSYAPQARQDFIAPTITPEYDGWVRAKVQASRDSLLFPIPDDEWQSIQAAQLAKVKETP